MLVIRKLVWDTWNIEHIARHDVTPEEVEEACNGNYSIRETYGGRLMMISPTQNGRLLAIVLAPKTEAGAYYTVSAWTASGKLRRFYEEEHGNEEAA
jgi:hypothetical protein